MAADVASASALIAEIGPFESLRSAEQNGANASIVKAVLALAGQHADAARPLAAWPVAPDSLARLRDLMAGWRNA